MPLRLAETLTVERVQPAMRATSKREALDELATLAASGDARLRELIAAVLAERERLASTAIGDEVAIPHGKLDQVSGLTLALGRSADGIDFESVDGNPTRLFFVLLAPGSATGLHLKALARISRLCKEPMFRSRLQQARSAVEMFEVLCSEDAKLRVQ
jgi:PTS system nitrogen regulatory IIA component